MSTRLAKLLITSTAIAILALPAYADPSNGSPGHPAPPPQQVPSAGASTNATTVLNGQVTFGAQWSTLNTTVNGAGGDVVVQSTAAGNVVDITTFNDTHVQNNQDDESTNIGSTLNANVSNVYGGVSISGQATCNSASISTDPAITDVRSLQVCNAQDPGSEVNAHVNNIGGDVSIASTAAGNAYEEDTNAASAPVSIVQSNSSNVFGTANATIRNVGGSVGVTSSAVGNTAQIVHYTTTGTSTGSSSSSSSSGQ